MLIFINKNPIHLRAKYFFGLTYTLFVLLILGLLILNIKNQSLIRSKASAETRDLLAKEERDFTKSIVDSYSTDYSNFSLSLQNAFDYARTINPYTKGPNSLSGAYRALCMMVTGHMVAYGQSATAEDTIIKYFINNYSSGEMRTLINDHANDFTAAIPVYDCLFSASLAKNILPDQLTGTILEDVVLATRTFYPVYPVDYYKSNWNNIRGNTPAEELGF